MKEIEVKSMVVADDSYVDPNTGEIESNVTITFDVPVLRNKKQLDGSYSIIEDTTIKMKSSALRAKLYKASRIIADAKRNSGLPLDISMINSILETAKVLKVQATEIKEGETFEGVLFAHKGVGYNFVIQFTDDDDAVAKAAAEKRKNRARAFLGI